ncbi:MAG: transpeptidase family protein [Prevotellaceae bacterium]|jgi:cell division protein FtsI (penicillin-binding protein 3)|nr:transpeptidase family protein [Prevotellaceae bacterium]
MSKDKNILRRLSLFYWMIFLFGILITGQIIILQFFSPEFETPGVRSEVVEPIRGNILTHDGRVMATSHVTYTLIMKFNTPALKKVFTDKNVKELSESLANFFKDKSAKAYEKELRHADSIKQSEKRIGNRDVNYIELQKIKKFKILKENRNVSGLIPVENIEREYPYLSFAHRTIGNMRNDENVGNKGIEGYYEEYLRGKPGERMLQNSTQGWIPIASEDDKIAENGYDVVTTIDINIQDVVETALINQLRQSPLLKAGTAIVMEVETGEIRAIANIAQNSDGSFSERENYAVSLRNDPGSTFKLATLIALLEDGHIDLNTTVDIGNGSCTIGGKTYRDVVPPYGRISVLKAFEKSSNVAFAKLVSESYKGKEKQKDFVKHFQNIGLDSPFYLDIKEEEGLPHIPHPDKSGWSGISATQAAIGYEVSLAPIHTLTLYNAVANNGKMIKPKFVTQIQKHGQTVKTFPTEVIANSICSKATLEKTKTALEGVVKEGTAKHIKSDIYRIAGKTGTARMLFPHSVTKRMVYEERIGNHIIKVNQPSFAGYFPADNPKYSAIVVLYTHKSKDDFHGGKWAAPVFKEFADRIYSLHPEWHEEMKKTNVLAEVPVVKGGKSSEVGAVLSKLNIPHNSKANNADWVQTKINSKRIEIAKVTVKDVVPSVINMGLKDAIYILENLGLQVQLTGKGIIKRQSIQPGTKVVKGQNITLTLEI